MSAAIVCAHCGWLEPPADHRCMVVERRVPRFNPVAIDPVPVSIDDEVSAQAALVLLRAERDQLEKTVADLQQQVGDLEEQLAMRTGLGVDAAAARIEQLEVELAQRDKMLAELERDAREAIDRTIAAARGVA